MADTTTRLDDAAARIAELEEEAVTQRPLVEARLVELYKLGRASYARLLFSGGDLRALGRTYRLIGSLARRDQERFDGHRQTIAARERLDATLEGLGNDGALTAAPVALPLGPFRGQL